MMPVVAKWELYIPYDLAYGSRETGSQIKPFSTLIRVSAVSPAKQLAASEKASATASSSDVIRFAGDTALTRQEAAEMLVQAADDYHCGVKTEDILKGYPCLLYTSGKNKGKGYI